VVAGASAACAAGAWLVHDPVMLRVLVAAAAAAAVTGAVLMRQWDRAAGRRVAELARARARDEWRAEERVAEFEADLEESRELRGALESKLRAKRSELSRLRNEHAGLLRRYATAETERASALEGRRLLALEAASPVKALPAGSVPGPREGVAAADRPAPGAPTRDAYRRAGLALTELLRNGARQQVKAAVEAARRRDLAEHRGAEEEPRGKHAAVTGEDTPSGTVSGAAAGKSDARDGAHTGPGGAGRGGGTRGTETQASGTRRIGPAGDTVTGPGRRHPVSPAAAVVPYQQRRPAFRGEGGFDFFGTQAGAQAATQDDGRRTARSADGKTAGRAAQPSAAAGAGSAASASDAPAVPAPDEDLADIVGADAVAERQAERQAEREATAEGIGEVIDLTEYDETEQFDMRELRLHSS
jgi:hypothetical protein